MQTKVLVFTCYDIVTMLLNRPWEGPWIRLKI